MFIPIAVMCLVAEPDRCAVFNGPIVETEEICMINMMTQGLPNLTEQMPDTYIAGVTCLELDILDQAAEAQ